MSDDSLEWTRERTSPGFCINENVPNAKYVAEFGIAKVGTAERAYDMQSLSSTGLLAAASQSSQSVAQRRKNFSPSSLSKISAHCAFKRGQL
jgi:hypothetical protein